MKNKFPKLMCACGHMADGDNNVTICKNCWKTSRLILTGDGAHDYISRLAASESKYAALLEVVKAQRKALTGTLPRLRGELYSDHPEVVEVEEALALWPAEKDTGEVKP